MLEQQVSQVFIPERTKKDDGFVCLESHVFFQKKHMYPKNLTAPIHFGWEDEFPFPPVFLSISVFGPLRW